MLVFIERERNQFKTDLMQGMREAFAEALKHHEGDTTLAFRHLHLVTTKRFAIDKGSFSSSPLTSSPKQSTMNSPTNRRKTSVRTPTSSESTNKPSSLPP